MALRRMVPLRSGPGRRCGVGGGGMLDEDELRSMTPEERERLARTLAAIAEPDPLEDPRFRFGRGFWLALTGAGCILLAAWIGVLAVPLPRPFTAGAWRGAWAGFDVARLTAFPASPWAAWRRTRVLFASRLAP